jgi:hypothetical protein
VRPNVTFKEGGRIHVKFKYPPTQDEFNLAMLRITEAIKYANQQTGLDLHIIGWEKKES